jgi:hypothetical protein
LLPQGIVLQEVLAQYPSHVFLNVYVASKDAAPFVADDTKFFILDGTGQQLRHVSLDEIKYGIQLQVAQNWKGGNYPPPPPPSPQRQYTISGVQNGNYTITDLGGGIGSASVMGKIGSPKNKLPLPAP